MNFPPLPKNENERLEALRSLEIVDTTPEETFDEITHLVCRLMHVPMAAITLVDSDRLWFKSNYGLEGATTIERQKSICAHTIAMGETLTVPDTRQDERFKKNSLVTGPPGIIFYIGEPILDEDGYALGALCAMDHRPRELSADQVKTLRLLARNAYQQMKLRRNVIELQRKNSNLGRLHAKTQSYLDKSRYEVAEIDIVENGIRYLMKNKSVIRTTGPSGHSAFTQKFEKAIHQDGPVEFILDQMKITVEVIQRGKQGRNIFSVIAQAA